MTKKKIFENNLEKHGKIFIKHITPYRSSELGSDKNINKKA